MTPTSALLQARSATTWILVADGGSAQIYHYRQRRTDVPMRAPQWRSTNQGIKRPQLTRVPGMSFAAEPLGDFQVGPDGRGTLIGGTDSAHNSCEPHLDIREEVKQNLALAISEKLNKACQDRLFDRLVIAASPKILGLLRQSLSAQVSDRTCSETPKDFTNAPQEALLAHLQETLG